MITGLHHVNIIIPPGENSLLQANEFYGKTLGLTPRPVPLAQKDRLAWFDIGPNSGQQVHVAFGRADIDFTETARKATRHPCFRVESVDKLRELQERVWGHFVDGKESEESPEVKGKGKADGELEEEKKIRKDSAPTECDQPGQENSGAKGPEYPTRFFARDFAGNRLEFTV